jgi:acetyltransferase-like isoleucine patch superfamily enzyme
MSPENTPQYSGMMNLLREQDDMPIIHPEIYQPTVLLKTESIFFHGVGIRIDSFVKIEGGEGVHIGAGVHIASFAHLNIGGGELIIEDYAAVASGGRIVTGSNQLDAVSLSASAPAELQRVSRGKVKLCRFATVMTNAVVLPNVTLGIGAVLAAGSVARCNIPDWEVWAGVPAKKIATRIPTYGTAAL